MHDGGDALANAALRRFFPKTRRNPRPKAHWPTILSSPNSPLDVVVV